MINRLRKIVAGPKKCLEWDQKELDFTYITDSVVAMAFPAQGLESTYRNSRKQISKFLNERHKDNYLIINVSNRVYDTKHFSEQVINYIWQDHQAPTLDVLFQISNDALTFLSSRKKRGVVCFHCNHGKGRTGTAIICFILFLGFFTQWQETLKFYNKRRFSDKKYGVDQPCQLRYIQYFNNILNLKEKKIDIFSFKLKLIETKQLSKDYFINISSIRSQQNKHIRIGLQKKVKINFQIPIIGDIHIQLWKKGLVNDSIITRADINLNFIPKIDKNQSFMVQIDGNQVKMLKTHKTNFKLYLYFQIFCQCHQKNCSKIENLCLCQEQRAKQEKAWQTIFKILERRKNISSGEACKILFCTSLDQDEQFNYDKKLEEQEVEVKLQSYDIK